MPTYLNVLNNAILRANLPASKGNPAAYGNDTRLGFHLKTLMCLHSKVLIKNNVVSCVGSGFGNYCIIYTNEVVVLYVLQVSH